MASKAPGLSDIFFLEEASPDTAAPTSGTLDKPSPRSTSPPRTSTSSADPFANPDAALDKPSAAPDANKQRRRLLERHTDFSGSPVTHCPVPNVNKQRRLLERRTTFSDFSCSPVTLRVPNVNKLTPSSGSTMPPPAYLADAQARSGLERHRTCAEQ